MGKGKPRAREKGVLGHNSDAGAVSMPRGSLHVPLAPTYYPTEEEFRDPLEYIDKIRAEAEAYGICKIVPPESWDPPFALSLDSFSFPTKTQSIHQLQTRSASCDSETFELEYSRFLEQQSGKKLKKKKKKRVVFEGEELDLCKLFNAVKRFGGYHKAVKEKKWGEISRFVRPGRKVSQCAKHVLAQLYLEHLYDYEEYYHQLSKGVIMCRKRVIQEVKKSGGRVDVSPPKRRRKTVVNDDGDDIRLCDLLKKKGDNDQICEQCKSGLHGEVMLLCDRCDKGWHIHCLSPPLKQVPPGNWYCFECLNSDKDSFGFIPDKHFTLQAFRRLAERARRKWFSSSSASRVEIEKKFWEIVEGSAGEVDVKYGSDLDTSIYGSGFPQENGQRLESVDPKLWEEYCRSPWNLNNLPKLRGSVLRAVHQNITGVMVPWLYIGMLFSSFCWHFEDHCFYSMNYLHWGEPKCWYSVPGSEAIAFEKVMRDCLPDLFDAQPDLLFQLVTMLNPSVLLEKGVPVYTVLQEPRNFVITFPRSYHGGFNFGLNCAEAVNFAPADWLPHGGFAAELYRMYHKTAVLSHEELLCVLAKGDCDGKFSPHLKNELLRIYGKEKKWREKLWRRGLIRSSPMPPRKFPELVGTEEGPICVICKQFLYVSAVICRCRPSTFVCLEHSEQICECGSSRRCLLYRHTLNELLDMVPKLDKDVDTKPQISYLPSQISSFQGQNALAKKVKGAIVSLDQLAEEWLLCSRCLFQNPFSADACATLLKEAEQFLWAGAEMNQVRDAVKKLNVARKWAEDIRNCMSEIRNRSSSDDCCTQRVQMEYVAELLNFVPVPCNEPEHANLKVFAEEARLLIQEIDSLLSSQSQLIELENLYRRVCSFPIHLRETEMLWERISTAKIWVDLARKCILEKRFGAVDVDALIKLKAEVKELHVQLPEIEMVLDLLSQTEICQAMCAKILNGPCGLKNVELLLQDWDQFTVNVPELTLLKQHHLDAVSWISRYEEVLVNCQGRGNQDDVVDNLHHLLQDGTSLSIQVDHLSSLEVELKKACCRQKARRANCNKMPLDFVQQVGAEAVGMQISSENLFVDLSGEVVAAICWEDRAAKVLEHKAPMSDFEDLIRSSEGIAVVVPSLHIVKEAVSFANSWLKNSEVFLVSPSNVPSPPCLFELETLKELVIQAKSLRISLKEEGMLNLVSRKCVEWELAACSALHDAENLLNKGVVGDEIGHSLVGYMEPLISRIETLIKDGTSLGFDFSEMPKLKNISSVLQWCIRVLSFCCTTPSIEDVETLIEVTEGFNFLCISGAVWSSLLDGVKWLRRALKVISRQVGDERCKLSDAAEVFAQSQGAIIKFPTTVDQLVDTIKKHELWSVQVHQFFNENFDGRTWSLLQELKECGNLSCSELDMVIFEVEKIEQWRQRCQEIICMVADDGNDLIASLRKIRQSLDMSLDIFGRSQSSKASGLCICGENIGEHLELLSCASCDEGYHMLCLEPVGVNTGTRFVCAYCLVLEKGVTTQKEVGLLAKRSGVRQLDLRTLMVLLSDADGLFVRIEEIEMLREVVMLYRQWQTCLRDTLDSASSLYGKDLNILVKTLAIALKAIDVAGIHDNQLQCDLELAIARNSWKVRVSKLLASQRPTMHQIHYHINEGLTWGISSDDYFSLQLEQLKQVGLHWASQAKVVIRSGPVNLDRVFELISDGESLTVYCEKELKLLRAQITLYCICRRPYDDRAKVTCDQCQEWYHLDCIKLLRRPKVYVCAACNPEAKLSSPLRDDLDRSNGKLVEPKTPSPRRIKIRLKLDESKMNHMHETVDKNENGIFNRSSGIDQSWWRNRKPFRRVARKRTDLDSLTSLFSRW